jgi:phosphopantothenoylcysteine synthetase/decarboxylase
MNAPARIPSRLESDPVGLLMAGASEEELNLRRKLATARDLAGARIARLQSEDARQINFILLSMATQAVFAPATTETLQQIRNCCLRLLMAADACEKLENPA